MTEPRRGRRLTLRCWCRRTGRRREAGLNQHPVRPRLRDEIWVKLWGNLSFNPISALTHATLDVLCTDPGTRAVARGMMLEAQQIAEKLGVKFPIDVDRRIEGGATGACAFAGNCAHGSMPACARMRLRVGGLTGRRAVALASGFALDLDCY